MILIESKAIEALGYDVDEKQMHVKFHSGKTYVYESVSQNTFNSFVIAPSAGSFYHENISGQYDFYEF